MFSSLLPPPKHSPIPTIPVRVPRKSAASKALMLPQTGPLAQPPQDRQQSLLALQYGQPAPDNPSVITSSLEDTIPLKKKYPHLKHHFPRYTLRTCPDESLATCVEQTKAVVERLLKAASGVEEAGSSEASLVRYNASSLNAEKDTVLEIRNYKEDPMLPPKFKLRKNREKPPPPPQPVLKAASTEKITKEMKDKWHIPSAVSNWKNNQGFAIALEKRVAAASGGSVKEGADINLQKFSQLSLALESADKKAREELDLRNKERRDAALKEQAEKEKRLDSLLQKSKALKRSSGDASSNYKHASDPDWSSRKKHKSNELTHD